MKKSLKMILHLKSKKSKKRLFDQKYSMAIQELMDEILKQSGISMLISMFLREHMDLLYLLEVKRSLL